MPKIAGVFLTIASILAIVTACNGPAPTTVQLTGQAILPADTFCDGPTVGHQLDAQINGRQTPFNHVPVQGFSSLIHLDGTRYAALQDNGFGSRANSPDYPLRWYTLDINFHEAWADVLAYETFVDDQKLLPYTLPGDHAYLTGAWFDPESFVAVDEEGFWVGEEFGPALLRISKQGQLLTSPLAVPVVPPLTQYARESAVLRTPDHPDFLDLAEEDRLAQANLPRSGGLEGLAATPSRKFIYASVEKAMIDDPVRHRRTLLQFDPQTGAFTGRFWFYRTDNASISIASLEAFNETILLVLERDGEEGHEAAVKRIYRIDLDQADAEGFLIKSLVCDLLDIQDSRGLTQAEDGAVGLGTNYGFPYVTPEALVIVDAWTLIVGCDNNFPFSTGRRPPSTPDDNEFIRLRLPRSLAEAVVEDK